MPPSSRTAFLESAATRADFDSDFELEIEAKADNFDVKPTPEARNLATAAARLSGELGLNRELGSECELGYEGEGEGDMCAVCI